MSSTSAVAVLAQGLRDLREFAEGPDGEDLQDRTGLSAEQIDTALAGERLPPREVTLALVEAWEGDVEAWEAYWAQIAELAKDAGGARKSAPTPPEPSIITPIVAEAGEGQSATEAATVEPAVRPADEPAVQEAAGEPGGERVAQAAGEDSARSGGAESAAPTGEHPAGEAVAAAGVAVPATGEGADRPAGTAGAAAATSVQGPAEDAARSGSADAPADAPAARSAGEADQSAGEPAPAKTQRPAEPPSKSLLTRIGIPALLFAVGVGVGAFGDHALSSDSASKPQPASVPTASQGASSAPHSSASSSSSAATSSSSHSSSASSSASESSSSSESPSGSSSSAGTTLGAYSGIQLASGYSVDFLNDTYHPVTGTSAGVDTMGFFATSFVDGRFYADRVAILDPQDTGSYTACLNDTRYQHDVLLSQVSAGSSFCVHTETGHLVLVTVRRMPSSTDANPYAVLDLTVWQSN